MHFNSAKFVIFAKNVIVMDKLFEYSNKLVREMGTSFFRYMYDEINWKSRMIGLVGPRGVGKTTLVLQYIKQNLNPAETLYVTHVVGMNILRRLSDSRLRN